MNPSLIVTPNAYKAGKLYSIVPTDGAGDLDVVRATTATYVGSDGLIKTALANEVRLDYTNGSCPSILVEPQRTNLCLQSEMFTQSPWGGTTATITPNTDIAPNGTLTADTLTDNSTTVRQQVGQSFNVLANTAYTTSFFIKKTTGTLTSYPALQIFYSGIANRIIALILNTSTGTFNFLASGVSPVNSYSAVVKDYKDYWRVELTTVDNQSNNSLSIALIPAFSGDGITTSNVVTGSNIFWGAQLEAGSNATSYIPTVASSVTRNADLISKSGISDLIGQTEGTIYCEINNTFYINGDTILDLSDGSISNRIRISRLNGNRIQLLFFNSGSITVNIVNAINSNIEPIKKIAIGYAVNNVAMYINGILINTDIDTPVPSLNKINLGSRVTNDFIFDDKISKVYLLKTRLTNTELQQLTTL